MEPVATDLPPLDPNDAQPLRPPILVVDDDPLMGVIVESCLDFEGARVLAAHTLGDARLLLAPDLAYIVLDRRLPDGDGLELLPEIEATCPQVPVVVYSALDDGAEPAHLRRVEKSDIATLAQVLDLEPVPDFPADQLVRLDAAPGVDDQHLRRSTPSRR